MANESFQEKTEKATPRRRNEAKEEGNVARSVEIGSAVIILVGMLSIYLLGKWMGDRIQWGMVSLIKESSHLSFTVENIDEYAWLAVIFLVQVIGPVSFILMIFGIAVNIAQTGFLFTLKPLEPKLSKLNPLEGVKRLFSLRSVIELAKGILKISIVGYLAYLTIKGDFDKNYLLMDMNIFSILSFIGKIIFKLVMRIGLLLLVLAIIDFLYQKWEFERKLKMSKQEIKDEYRQIEGDPHVKGRLRSLRRQFLLNSMIRDLPDADVVITNPTMLAIALKYDIEAMTSPKVVAKGARKIAERIRKIAEENNIPIVENKELARALYKSVDVGMEIPSQFYQAVAEVLSYVYRLKGKRFL